MNAALLRKTARDAAALTALGALAIIGFEALWVLAMANMADTLVELWQQLGFVRRLLQVMFSIDVEAVSAQGLISFGMVHPFLLAVSWGVLIAGGTRTLAGEIDRGTADLLLSLPLTRPGAYVTVSLVGVATCVAFGALPLAGLALGATFVTLREPIDFGLMGIVAANFLALLLAVTGATMLVSAVVTRRGLAVAILVSGLLLSFLINFLEALIPAVAPLRFLGLLNYYRPVEVVRDNAWPLGNMLCLVGLAGVTWTAGLVWFSRRDIPAP